MSPDDRLDPAAIDEPAPGELDHRLSAPVGASERSQTARMQALTFRGEHVVARPLPRPGPRITLTLPGTLEFGDLPSTIEAEQMRERITALAAANERARHHSLDRLATWFPGYDFDIASQTTDDRRFSVLAIGPSLFEHLDALSTVESLLSTRDFPGNRLQFSHGERPGDRPHRATDPNRPNLQRVAVGPLVDALEQRWTTILNGIDDTDPATASVAEHLERVYGCRINTNVYVSWGDARGFGAHWDQHDTIIVQAAGTKRWKVFEPATLSPLRPWVDDSVSPRPVWEGTISPGECLIIPRGWGHEVLGSDDLSIHYTIGVNRVTVHDALERLQSEAGFHPIFRADLTYDPSRPSRSYDRSVLDDERALTEAIAELGGAALLQRALATHRSRLPLRMFPRLFDTWLSTGTGEWHGAVVRLPAPAGIHLVAASPGSATVAVGDNLVDLTIDAFDLVTTLADAQVHPVATLGDHEPTHSILGELVRAGLVEVRFPND